MKSEFFWDKISANYDKQVKKYDQAYKDTIDKTKKHLNKTDIVLDFACGTGITTIQLSDSVKEIHAIDISQQMINIAEKKANIANAENVKFYKTDLFDNEFNKDTYDAVLAFNVLYFLKNTPETIIRIFELLKTGGLFISVTDCLGENPSFLDRVKQLLSKIGILPFMDFLSITELEGLVTEADFKVVETANLYDDPPNFFIAAKKAT